MVAPFVIEGMPELPVLCKRKPGRPPRSCPDNPICQRTYFGAIVKGVQYKRIEFLEPRRAQRLTDLNIKPIELVTFPDIKKYNRDQLRGYGFVYGFPRKTKPDMIRLLAEAAAFFHPDDPEYNLDKFLSSLPCAWPNKVSSRTIVDVKLDPQQSWTNNSTSTQNFQGTVSDVPEHAANAQATICVPGISLQDNSRDGNPHDTHKLENHMFVETHPDANDDQDIPFVEPKRRRLDHVGRTCDMKEDFSEMTDNSMPLNAVEFSLCTPMDECGEPGVEDPKTTADKHSGEENKEEKQGEYLDDAGDQEFLTKEAVEFMIKESLQPLRNDMEAFREALDEVLADRKEKQVPNMRPYAAAMAC